MGGGGFHHRWEEGLGERKSISGCSWGGQGTYVDHSAHGGNGSREFANRFRKRKKKTGGGVDAGRINI